MTKIEKDGKYICIADKIFKKANNIFKCFVCSVMWHPLTDTESVLTNKSLV